MICQVLKQANILLLLIIDQLFEIYALNRAVLDGERNVESSDGFLSFPDEIEEALEVITSKYGVDAFELLFRMEGAFLVLSRPG